MGCPAHPAKMKMGPFLCNLGLLLLLIGPARSEGGGEVSYHFYNFEGPRFAAGNLSGGLQGLNPVQGTARIAAPDPPASMTQYLHLDRHRPHCAMVFTG